MRKAIGRFSEGFALTVDEIREKEECESHNQNIRAYSTSSLGKLRKPNMPDIPERIRRGIQKILHPRP